MTPIIIKRYGNRKHYMTGKYTTLKEIQKLFLEGQRFIVVDFTTNNDIALETIGKVLVNIDTTKLLGLTDLLFEFTQKIVLTEIINQTVPSPLQLSSNNANLN